MFRTLSISGFRGFEHLKVDGLDRFSLFLGRNNVGKTAALEAIFLLAGPTNPDLPLRVNVFRGIEHVRIEPEEIWGWLFHSKNLEKEIRIELEREAHKRRSLTIKLGESVIIRRKVRGGSKPRARPSSATVLTTKGPKELVLKYQNEAGKKVETKAFVSEKGIETERNAHMKFPTSVYVSARSGYSSENPARFSELEEVGRENEILPALQVLEPRLQKLAVLVSGGGSMIYGDVGLGRMIPLPMMGEGIGRLLTILLAISASENGLVLVDEIDTGFHYSAIENMWTAVAKLARDMNVQVFATTHSWECLKAAHESFSKSETYDFRLHRLDMIKGKVESTTYDAEMVTTALASGMELR
jgi:predicted ATPase